MLRFLFFISIILLFAGNTKGRKRRTGDYVKVGNSFFMIWGGAKTGIMPKGASCSHNSKMLYVSNFGKKNKENISVFKANPLTFKQFINYPGNSIESIVSPNNNILYSTNMYGHYLDLINLKTFKLKKRIKVLGFPKVILPDNKNNLYLSLWETRGIARINLDTHKVEKYYTGGINPRGMALSQDGKKLYIANNGSRNYSVVKINSLIPGQRPEVKHIRMGYGPRHAVVSKDGKTLYISVMGNSSVYAINTSDLKIKKRIKVGRKPKTIMESYDGKFLYTADYYGHSITIIDTATYQTKILQLPLVRSSGLTVRPDDKFIYVTGWCTHDIWAVQRIDPGYYPHLPLGNDYSKFRHYQCRKCKRDLMGCTILKKK